MSSLDRVAAAIQLMRVPLAATTVTDIWAGYFGARALGLVPAGEAGETRTLVLLHASALLFYVAGMTLNDVFDAERDREVHPQRPIPSGAIGRRQAAVVGAGELLAANALALVAGPRYGLIAAALTAAILLYDGLLKRFAIPGAFLMGLCRYLDVQLGAGFAGGMTFGPALAIFGYVTALTFLSTLEERPRRDGLAVGLAALVGWLLAAGMLFPRHLLAAWVYGPLAGVAVFTGMRVYHTLTPASARRLTFVLLLGIFAVNAGSLAGCGAWPLAVAAGAMVLSFPLLLTLQAAAVGFLRTPPDEEHPAAAD